MVEFGKLLTVLSAVVSLVCLIMVILYTTESVEDNDATDEMILSTCSAFGVVNDVEHYEEYYKGFIGLNPVNGLGSGFVFHTFVDPTFGTVPDPNSGREDQCTCDCKPGPDGIGCAGYGGIAFRSASLLVSPGIDCDDDWTGQIIATDCGAALGGRCPENISDTQEFNEFTGQDRRAGPGGATVYAVSCTRGNCMNAIGGVFRQSNSPTSCLRALDEDPDSQSSCAFKCGDEGLYSEWLDYCAQPADTSIATGFTGWGV